MGVFGNSYSDQFGYGNGEKEASSQFVTSNLNSNKLYLQPSNGYIENGIAPTSPVMLANHSELPYSSGVY